MSDPVLREWFLARCVNCLFTLPFTTAAERDRWAAEHGETGHRVLHGFERRWRVPTVIDGDTGGG